MTPLSPAELRAEIDRLSAALRRVNPGDTFSGMLLTGKIKEHFRALAALGETLLPAVRGEGE